MNKVPVSLWLRSDPDDRDREDQDAPMTMIRVCKQGENLKDSATAGIYRHSLHPIHYELVCDDSEMPVLDLSVYGTPDGVDDDAVKNGTNDDLFVTAEAGKLIEHGRFEHQLSMPVGPKRKEVLHVYIYVSFNRMSVQLDAVFAVDGHEIKGLERTPSGDILRHNELAIEWRTHSKIEMKRLHLWQVARPELLGSIVTQPASSIENAPRTGKLPHRTTKRATKRKRSPEDSPEGSERRTSSEPGDE